MKERTGKNQREKTQQQKHNTIDLRSKRRTVEWENKKKIKVHITGTKALPVILDMKQCNDWQNDDHIDGENLKWSSNRDNLNKHFICLRYFHLSCHKLFNICRKAMNLCGLVKSFYYIDKFEKVRGGPSLRYNGDRIIIIM